MSVVTRAEPNLVSALRLASGVCVTLRPVGPPDASVLQTYVRGLSPGSRYNRFFGALSELSAMELDRVTHLDQKYKLALLAETRVDGATTVIGEARFALATNQVEGEFALSIADDWHGKGLGTLLLTDIECRARSLGTRYLVGDVLRSNKRMMALARNMGFVLGDVPRDTRLVRIVKNLTLSQAVRPCETPPASDLAIAA